MIKHILCFNLVIGIWIITVKYIRIWSVCILFKSRDIYRLTIYSYFVEFISCISINFTFCCMIIWNNNHWCICFVFVLCWCSSRSCLICCRCNISSRFIITCRFCLYFVKNNFIIKQKICCTPNTFPTSFKCTIHFYCITRIICIFITLGRIRFIANKI